MEYLDFIKSKKPKTIQTGFKLPSSHINSNAFDYQAEIIERACLNGRYALFPLFDHLPQSQVSSISTGLFFVSSYLRSYVIRRLFERIKK